MQINDIFSPCVQVTYRKQNWIPADFHGEHGVDLRCYGAGLGFNHTQPHGNYEPRACTTQITPRHPGKQAHTY